MKKRIMFLSLLFLGLIAAVSTAVHADEEAAPTSILYVTYSDPEIGAIAPNQEIILTKGAAPYTITAPAIDGYTYSGAIFYQNQLHIDGQKVDLPFTVQYQDPLEGYFTHIQWVNITYTPTGKRSVYRLYHSGLQVHLYTTDWNEYNVLQSRGWRDEGVAWSTETNKGDEVYRLYHSGLQVHLYTRDANEYAVLGTRGWRQEGVAYRSYGEIPIYRLYHSGLKKHLYTRDENERDTLQTRGWRYEGIAWYSQP